MYSGLVSHPNHISVIRVCNYTINKVDMYMSYNHEYIVLIYNAATETIIIQCRTNNKLN